jgi:hypothetical protein
MGFLEWATSPWGQSVPIHIAWFLIWVAVIAGLPLLDRSRHLREVFRQAKRVCGRRFSGRRGAHTQARSPAFAGGAAVSLDHGSVHVHIAVYRLPSEGGRPVSLGHLSLDRWRCVDGLHPFHIIHASFWLDFWSIWPDKIDLEDAWRRVRRFAGRSAPPPRKFAKYPLENKLFHGVIILCGLSVILTGVFMMFRVRTIFFPGIRICSAT